MKQSSGVMCRGPSVSGLVVSGWPLSTGPVAQLVRHTLKMCKIYQTVQSCNPRLHGLASSIFVSSNLPINTQSSGIGVEGHE